ncbi:MAG TPA: Arm DNA-binding domain-containing protein, partial [Hyphomicrobiaceae bacterium]
MPREALTQTFIDETREKPPTSRTIFWDLGMRGFGWQIHPAGHASYCLQYRHAGISRRFTIDGTLSLKDARKCAKALQGEVAMGQDVVIE